MAGQTNRFIEISHTIEHGMVTYKGLPAPVICDFLSREESRQHYAPGTEFNISKIEMVANTGTYLDSPFHRYSEGKDLAEIPLSSIANVPGLVFRVLAGTGRAIEADVFNGKDLKGKAVLIHTGWSAHFGTGQYFEGHPFLTEAAAHYLAASGVVLVGIDSYNIDDTGDGRRSAHTILLGQDIPIVEHLTNLAALPEDGFSFFAVPPKVKAFGTFPVRAFGMLNFTSES